MAAQNVQSRCTRKVARKDDTPQFAIRFMNKDFHLILETAARIQPVTAAAIQINTAEAADSTEEDFPAVSLAGNLTCLESHLGFSQGGTEFK